MENNIQIFNFEEQEVRTIIIDGEPWFVGKDVATILGYSNTRKAIRDHVNDVNKRFMYEGEQNVPPTQNYNPIIINESGLYRLILRSKLPSAERFTDWVTSEVLPSIRKTGQYQILDSYMIDDPVERATKWIEEEKKRQALETENRIMKPKAECFDTFLDTGELTGLRDSAHLLNISERKFMDFLEDYGYIYRNGKYKPRPYAKYLDKGYFEVKAVRCYDGKSRDQIFITPLGLSVINNKWYEYQKSFQRPLIEIE